MICLKGFVIFTSLCLSQSVKSEPKYTLQVIPECQVLEVSPGEQRCTYTLEDVKALYQIDTEFVKLQNVSMLQGQKLILQSDVISWQQEQLRLSAKNTTLFHNRMKHLTNLYIKTDKNLQTQLAKPKWGNYVAWGAAAMLATLFTGYVVADQIAK